MYNDRIGYVNVNRFPSLDFEAEDTSSDSIPTAVPDKSALDSDASSVGEGGNTGGGGLQLEPADAPRQDWSSYNEKLFAIGERKEEEEEGEEEEDLMMRNKVRIER